MINSISIVGSGALATFYAYRWSSEFNVSVLGSWKESLTAINSHLQKESSCKPKATSNWVDIKEPDLVVWLTKTYKNKYALKKYVQLKWKCPILILQNGIGQEELFYDILGLNQKLLRGITNQGAKLIGPGNVLDTGYGPVIVEESKLFEDFPVVQKKHIQPFIYNKLAINAVLNPVSALFLVSNKNAIKGQAGEYLKALVKICFPYFEKRQIFKSEKEYFNKVILVAIKTGENTNSMLVDRQMKRKTEILEILGPINNEINNRELVKIINLLKG